MRTAELHRRQRARVGARALGHPEIAHGRPLQRLGLLRQRKHELPEDQPDNRAFHRQRQPADVVAQVHRRAEDLHRPPPDGVREPGQDRRQQEVEQLGGGGDLPADDGLLGDVVEGAEPELVPGVAHEQLRHGAAEEAPRQHPHLRLASPVFVGRSGGCRGSSLLVVAAGVGWGEMVFWKRVLGVVGGPYRWLGTAHGGWVSAWLEVAVSNVESTTLRQCVP